MNIKKLPPQKYLNKLFRYEPETGDLYRKIKTSNSTNVGDLVGSNKHGYLYMSIDWSSYLVHRVIFKMVHGVDPKIIDHINGRPLDNRIKNLSSVTVGGNSRNQKARKTNASGTTGVSWNKNAKKWHAYIAAGKKNITLGYFDDIESAIAARKSAETKHGYHKNHGRPNL